ncbi:Protein kinase domain containing protein [Lasiodiplodia theobromae]|uniref:Protein kinase domain containing protein n=1 Tax=Lasiodiplodia theobromae TaxID=45133 RepID=UPI0015C3957F|nr:Protein kinase domain containing protein [Lasiodiplodia theobromae]KAF4536876.1 Protein kinase domain containing protein [Lasiodiplodia theobromae]
MSSPPPSSTVSVAPSVLKRRAATSSLRSGTRIIYGTLYDGKACALKMGVTAEAFRTELRAYKAISAVPLLQDYVCGFYGVVSDIRDLLQANCGGFRRALRLEFLKGPRLGDVIGKLSHDERYAIRTHLERALSILHEDAGVCHGAGCLDGFGDNAIVTSRGVARLVDFRHAHFKEDMYDDQWQVYVRRDRESLAELFEPFAEADAIEADREARLFLSSMDVSDARDKDSLAELLRRVPSPGRDFLDAIVAATSPATPDLAMALETALLGHGELVGTIDVLLGCAKECGVWPPPPPPPPPAPRPESLESDGGISVLLSLIQLTHALEMKSYDAPAQLEQKLESGSCSTGRPPASELYSALVQASPNAATAVSDCVQVLRYQISRITYLCDIGSYREAMDLVNSVLRDTARVRRVERECNELRGQLLEAMGRGKDAEED